MMGPVGSLLKVLRFVGRKRVEVRLGVGVDLLLIVVFVLGEISGLEIVVDILAVEGAFESCYFEEYGGLGEIVGMLEVVYTTLLGCMSGTYLHYSSWAGGRLSLSSWAVLLSGYLPWVGRCLTSSSWEVLQSSYSPWMEWEFARTDNTSKDLAYSMQFAAVERQASSQQTSMKP